MMPLPVSRRLKSWVPGRISWTTSSNGVRDLHRKSGLSECALPGDFMELADVAHILKTVERFQDSPSSIE
jgi:hypothetical protein